MSDSPETERPDTAPPESERTPRRQSERVREMQDRLIDATIECLDRHGYANTSISSIQDAAGVSRGAILHHYPSRQALIAATAARLLDAAIRPAREGRQNRRDSFSSIEDVMLFYWNQVVNVREGRAFIEILVACRTDEAMEEELSGLFTRWDAAIGETALTRFASVTQDPEDAVILWSICRTFLRGLIIHARFIDDRAHLERMVKRFAALMATQLSPRTTAH